MSKLETYERLNWRLVKLRGKKPIEDNWPNLNIDYATIKAYVEKDSVGLITGRVNNIVCVDCDGDGALAKFKEIFPGKTLTCKTPSGGRHYYFEYPKDEDIACPQDIFNTKKEHGWAIDIRGNYNGQAVIPPSKGYAWEHWIKPLPLPKEILDAIKAEKTASPKADILTILKGIEKGASGRIPSALELIGYLAKHKMKKQIALELVLAWNERNDPPLDPAHIVQKVEYIFSKENFKEIQQTKSESKSYMDHVNIINNRTAPEFTTGLKGLDDITWGFLRGGLHVWVAYSNTGKTGIMIKSAVMNARRGSKVLVFPTESSREDILDRVCTIFGKIHGTRFLDGKFTPEELKRIELIERKISDMDFKVMENPRPSFQDIQREVENYNPDIVYIDFFQRCRIFSESWQATRDLAIDLKDMAKRRNIPVVVMSQVNTEKYYDKKQGRYVRGMCNFWAARGGEAIGHEADTGLAMNLITNEVGDSFVKFDYQKSKKSRKGQIYTKFEGAYLKFTEITKVQWEAATNDTSGNM